MIAYVISLAAAALYGAADFAGGLSTKRAATIPVVLVSQAVGLLLLAAALPLFPAASPTRTDLLWGAVAGLSGGIGVALLYHGLASGAMAVVAPTTAVCAVTIPVVASIALGERPTPLVLAGIAIGIVSILLVSRPPVDAGRRGAGAAVIGTALASGVAIGCFLFALARTRAEAVMYPLIVSRAVSVALFLGIAIGTRQSPRIPRPVLGLTLAAGAGDILANALYLIAARIGPVSAVVTLSSLYPASTVILARFVLGERLALWQRVGVALALVAIALIVAYGRH